MILGQTVRHWPQALQRKLLKAFAHDEALFERMLALFAPAHRADLFWECTTETQRSQTIWGTQLLATLYHSARHVQARRILPMKRVQDSYELTLTYKAFLPPQEAYEDLLGATRHAQATRRGLAWASLIGGVVRSLEPMGGLLGDMSRLKNEQDPVRSQAYTALSHTPAHRFEALDAPQLLELTQYAIDARDTSWQTRSALHTLFANLLAHWAASPMHPLTLCAMEGLRRLAHQGGLIDLPRLEDRLPRGAEHALCEVLLPWLKASTQRLYVGNVTRLAASLGRRAYKVEPLQELLGKVIWTEKSHASQAAALWLEDPDTRERRVLALLKKDASAFYLPRVAEHLHLRRQDLLSPYLKGKPISGKFSPSSKNVYVIPTFQTGFRRWHHDQQVAFIKTLQGAVADADQSIWTRASLISRVARIPAAGLATLWPLLESSEVAIQEAALGALVWLDGAGGEELEVLCEYLGGDRARVAMYAIPRIVGLLPQAEVLLTLKALLERDWLKITVHKEILRLLGSMRTAEAVAIIATQALNPALHPDVQIAAIHAAYQSIDTTAGWELILKLPRLTTHPEVLKSLLTMSRCALSPKRLDEVLKSLRPLADHEDREVRQAFFGTVSYHLPWLVQAGQPLDGLMNVARAEIADTVSGGAWQDAAQVVAHALSFAPGQLLVKDLLQSFVEGVSALESVGSATEDRPLRQRLDALVQMIAMQPDEAIARTGKARLADEVSWPAKLWSHRLHLAITGTSWSAPWESMRALERTCAALPHLALLAHHTADLPAWLEHHQPFEALSWDSEPRMVAFLQECLGHEEVGLRSLGLEVLILAGVRTQWPLGLQGLLLGARGDEHAWIHTRARQVFMHVI